MTRQKQFVEDMTCCAAFLAMAEREKLMLNARSGGQAFEAFARLVGIPAFKLRVLARDKDVNEIIQTALR